MHLNCSVKECTKKKTKKIFFYEIDFFRAGLTLGRPPQTTIQWNSCTEHNVFLLLFAVPLMWYNACIRILSAIQTLCIQCCTISHEIIDQTIFLCVSCIALINSYESCEKNRLSEEKKFSVHSSMHIHFTDSFKTIIVNNLNTKKKSLLLRWDQKWTSVD